ncbi:MAG TPA: class III extradiol ring-cleavage dioxygenase [Xanthomonadaceae bacterium]|nr:class III extradiol ring-cleavage dioxygenase [Xanthomonadaceae bacterium]
MLPALFISHGAPDLAVDRGAAGRHLGELGSSLVHPKAIVIASAHYEAPLASIGAASHPAILHDFAGFDPVLKTLRYAAPGDPELAQRMTQMLAAADIPAWLDFQRGFDHGVWVPLLRMYPDADIPVVPLSVDRSAGAEAHWRLGLALAPLRAEGVLVIGSGAITHNLGELAWNVPDAPPPEWARAFADWMVERLHAGDSESVLDWARRAPHARRNHPTEEHLLPLFVAFGAAGPHARGRLLHRSWDRGALAMDVLAFG